MAQYEFNPAAINPEAIRDLMRQVGGTNLAGQSMAGPVATGQAYAQQIAGGMPMEQVIAPGVSYSPEMAGGYTQADLDMIARGPAPVMPVAPTQGTPLEASYETMPDAPVGTPAPERYVPGQKNFTGIPNFFANLDFSNLPDLSDLNLFGFNKKTLNDLSKDIGEKKLNDIIKDIDSGNVENNIPFSGMNFTSVPDGFNIPSIPTNFTPPIPTNFTPPSVPNMPSVPNVPPMPMSFTPPNVPASNFVQPSVEEIVSPLSRGRTLPPTPKGLFSL